MARPQTSVRLNGSLVKSLRARMSETQESFVARADVPFGKSTLYRIERGQGVGLHYAKALAGVFSVPVSDLIDEKDFADSGLEISNNKLEKYGAINISFAEGFNLRNAIRMLSHIINKPIDFSRLREDTLIREIKDGQFGWDSPMEALSSLGLLIIRGPQVELVAEEVQGRIIVRERGAGNVQ